MSEILTIKEIREKYTSGWILIDEVQTNEGYEVVGGRVVFHGSSREETHEKARELQPRRFAVRFMGERPKDIVLFL